MYTRMLVPLDGSKIAENVLPYARNMAGALKVPVQLLGVIEMSHYTSGARASYLDTLMDAAIRRNQEYLQSAAKTFLVSSVECTVEGGVPQEVIIAKAAENRGTLIALATHGRSGLNRWLLGSVAEKVLRGASNAVLLVRGTEEAKTEGEKAPERVIVPLDGSQLAEAVMPIVLEVAKAIKLKVVLLRVYSAPPIMYSIGHDDFLDDLNKILAESKSEATSYLDNVANQLKSKGLADVIQIVSEGEAAENIIELARGAPNSLIVMCTHGYSGVKSWVLGSVAEKVVRHGGNPVLVIRGL
ncbi:MAG TPA: universal stress protein [Anaerolineales bacterium]|nr:universal stress protein [Anaerolineales bacterium]